MLPVGRLRRRLSPEGVSSSLQTLSTPSALLWDSQVLLLLVEKAGILTAYCCTVCPVCCWPSGRHGRPSGSLLASGAAAAGGGAGPPTRTAAGVGVFDARARAAPVRATCHGAVAPAVPTCKACCMYELLYIFSAVNKLQATCIPEQCMRSLSKARYACQRARGVSSTTVVSPDPALTRTRQERDRVLQQQAAAREQQLKAQLQAVMANGTEAQRRELQAGQDALSQQVGRPQPSRCTPLGKDTTAYGNGTHGIRDALTLCTENLAPLCARALAHAPPCSLVAAHAPDGR